MHSGMEYPELEDPQGSSKSKLLALHSPNNLTLCLRALSTYSLNSGSLETVTILWGACSVLDTL